MKILLILLLSGLLVKGADITNATVTLTCLTAAGKTQTVTFDLSAKELKAWAWKSDSINAGQVITTNTTVVNGITNSVVSTNWPTVTFRGYLADQLQARINQQVRWSREERLAAIARRAGAVTNEDDLSVIENQLPK